MSSLKDMEKRYFEKLFGMQTGYVLDYSDNTFGEFFDQYKISIHSYKYQTQGTSKAKKLRSFWEQEGDMLVGQILGELLDSYEADCELNRKPTDQPVLTRARAIVDRLLQREKVNPENDPIEPFLSREFTIPNIGKLPVESSVVSIIESRLNEVQLALKARAYLSVIFLSGSILEAVLLGKAQSNPKMYNLCPASPKDKDGKVLMFNRWTLANLIDVSSSIGVIQPDIQKFSHGLRGFRNYIHPYEQLKSGFTPDEHTAKVCFQVLKAALASVSGER